MTWLGRLVRWLGHWRWFGALYRRMVPFDAWLFRRTGGRFGLVRPSGLPELLLTTTGARSGLARPVPLLYVRDGTSYVVVASNWGRAHHPGWSANLLANPDAQVLVAGSSVPVRAALLDGEDRARLWPAVLRIWPAYDTYAARSRRDLRVFRLTPVSSTRSTARGQPQHR